MPKEYTVKQIAERFGVHKQMVMRWFWDGRFPNARRKNPFSPSSLILIPEKDVEKITVAFEKAQPTRK